MKFIILLVVCSFLSSGSISARKVRAKLYTTDFIDHRLICAIRDKAKDLYNIRVVFSGKLKYPAKTDNGYKAEAFTNKLNKKRGRQEYAIGITDQDIIRYRIWDWFDFTFVADTILGFTDISGESCIISTAQLKDSNTFNRIVNVVMHELGHLVGLDHCEDEDCLMIPYDHLDNSCLCVRCKWQLQKIMSHEGQ
jgi:archaemetzincin